MFRPPLDRIPLFLTCRACRRPYRAVASFTGPQIVACAWCGHRVRMVPHSGA